MAAPRQAGRCASPALSVTWVAAACRRYSPRARPPSHPRACFSQRRHLLVVTSTSSERASDRGSVQRRPTDRPTALCVTIILELDAPQGHSRRTTHQLTLPRPPRPFSTTPMQRIWGIRCDRAYS